MIRTRTLPRIRRVPSLGYLFFAGIASILIRFTTAENDYSIRAEMGELTREEARSVLDAERAEREAHEETMRFWSES